MQQPQSHEMLILISYELFMPTVMKEIIKTTQRRYKWNIVFLLKRMAHVESVRKSCWFPDKVLKPPAIDANKSQLCNPLYSVRGQEENCAQTHKKSIIKSALYLLHNWRRSHRETLASVCLRHCGTRSAACWRAVAQTLAFHQIQHGWVVSLLINECDGAKLLTGSNVEEVEGEDAPLPRTQRCFGTSSWTSGNEP